MQVTSVCTLAWFLLLAGGPSSAAGPIEQPLQRAAQAGLPVEVLDNKVAEGRAKRIPPARIAQVLDRLVTYMLDARAWLRQRGKARSQRVPAVLLAAVAEARLAGIHRRTLRELVPPGSSANRARRVDALVDLRLRGYPPGVSRRLVLRAQGRDLPALGQIADGVRRRTGLTHAEVADNLLRGLRRARSLNAAATRAFSVGHGRKPDVSPPGKLRGKAHGARGRGRHPHGRP